MPGRLPEASHLHNALSYFSSLFTNVDPAPEYGIPLCAEACAQQPLRCSTAVQGWSLCSAVKACLVCLVVSIYKQGERADRREEILCLYHTLGLDMKRQLVECGLCMHQVTGSVPAEPQRQSLFPGDKGKETMSARLRPMPSGSL